MERIIQKISEITELALKVNHQAKHTVFVSIRGHVDQLDFEYYKNKWNNDKDATLNTQIHYGKYELSHNEDGIMSQLDIIITLLNELL